MEINKRTQSGWKNWKKISGILYDKRVPERVTGKIYKTVAQLAMLNATETLNLASRHVRKLETTEMKVCWWTCGHTRKEHVKNDIRNRLEVEKISVLCKKSRLRWMDIWRGETLVVWEDTPQRWILREKRKKVDQNWNGSTVLHAPSNYTLIILFCLKISQKPLLIVCIDNTYFINYEYH